MLGRLLRFNSSLFVRNPLLRMQLEARRDTTSLNKDSDIHVSFIAAPLPSPQLEVYRTGSPQYLPSPSGASSDPSTSYIIPVIVNFDQPRLHLFHQAPPHRQ